MSIRMSGRCNASRNAYFVGMIGCLSLCLVGDSRLMSDEIDCLLYCIAFFELGGLIWILTRQPLYTLPLDTYFF